MSEREQAIELLSKLKASEKPLKTQYTFLDGQVCEVTYTCKTRYPPIDLQEGIRMQREEEKKHIRI